MTIVFFQVQEGLAGANDLLFLLVPDSRLFFYKKVKITFADLFTWIARPKFECMRPIGTGETALKVFEIDIIGDIFHECIQDVFLPGQLGRTLLDSPHQQRPLYGAADFIAQHLVKCAVA